jgi:hypothetical protein
MHLTAPGRLHAAALVVALALMACQPRIVEPGARIDGWVLGELVDCADLEERDRCAAELRVAEQLFGGELRLPVSIIDRSLWTVPFVEATTSAPPRVAVFVLADGSVRAQGVGYAGVEGPIGMTPNLQPVWPPSPRAR